MSITDIESKAFNDISNNLTTVAIMNVGNTFESSVDISYDEDWIKIELQLGKTYDVNLNGITLRDTYLRGIYDKNGALLSNTQNDDSNGTLNSYVKFKASYTGEYYINATGYGSNIGSYSLTVKDNNIINGTNNNDIINGTNNNDILNGTVYDDIINGLSGNDTISSGAGNDVMNDVSGDDIYKFSLENGIDKIIDSSGVDNIIFDSTISKENIVVYLQSNNDLIFKYSSNDLLNISTWGNTANKIEKVQLSDGNYLSSTDIDKLIQSMSAYASTKGISLSNIDSVSKNTELMTMIASSWHK